jgi:hypothetical protein
LDDANIIISNETFANADELLPTLESFVKMLAHPEQIQTQFAKIESSIPRKLDMVAQLITQSLSKASVRFKECLQAALEGLESKNDSNDLLSNYAKNYSNYYCPFFMDKEYIFENYLVNQVVTRLFPFTRGSYLDLYRELVCNLSVIQLLLVGIAAKNKGLNEALVVKLFQTFARNSNHNSGHFDKLITSLHTNAQDSFVDVMWLLKETSVKEIRD